MNLPECQQPPAKVRSKEAPRRPPMRGGRCIWWPHLFFPRESLGRTLAGGWPRHENKSRELCGSRASGPHFFLHDRMTRQWRFLFSIVGQWLQRQWLQQ